MTNIDTTAKLLDSLSESLDAITQARDAGNMDEVGYHTRQAQQAAVGLESMLGGGE